MAAWNLITDATDTEKDGHDLLVGYAIGGRQLVARWKDGNWVASDQHPIFPTHYQELGPPPDPATLVPVPPVLTTLVPASAPLGAPSFTLSVQGSGFSPDAVIYWNGSPEPTIHRSPTEVTTDVNMATAQVAMAIPVVVKNGDGSDSNELTFTLTEAEPEAGEASVAPSHSGKRKFKDS